MSEQKNEYYETIYSQGAPIHHHAYILDGITRMLAEEGFPPSPDVRVLDLGCGNGSLTANVAALGYQVTGVDSSQQGIETAKKHFPAATFVCADIAAMPASIPEGGYQVVMAVEVIEHLYAPRMLTEAARKYLAPNGRLLLTTPYHGYWKNLAVAAMGKCDSHFNPLWDGGHVKFFSPATLRKLLEQQGIRDVRFGYVGRFPYFWKSMVCSCRMNGTQAP